VCACELCVDGGVRRSVLCVSVKCEGNCECVCVCRPELILGIFLNCSVLSFETGFSLYLDLTSLARLARHNPQGSPPAPVSASLVMWLQACNAILGFLSGFWVSHFRSSCFWDKHFMD